MARAGRSPPVRSLAKPLARVGDPLVLADGRVIEPIPAGGVKVEKVDARPHDYKATKRRNIADLSAKPAVLNGIGVVLVYTLLGVGDREIAEALRIHVNKVKEVRKHPTYTEIFSLIQDEYINANSELIQARIASYGSTAVDTAADVMMDAKGKAPVRLKAAEDFVEWGGYSKSNNVKGGAGMEALRILVTKGDDKTEISIGNLNQEE